MKISIQDISEEGLIWEEDAPVSAFSMLCQIEKEENMSFSSPISARIEIMPRYGFFDVTGHVKTMISFQCGRCLDPFEIPIRGKISISFARELPDVEDTTGEEIELSADDMGIFLLEEPIIDVTRLIEEQIMLEIPYSPVCSETCQGLCHTCGANLNTQQCMCRTENIDPRWEALKKLQRSS